MDSMAMGQVRDSMILKGEGTGSTCCPPPMPAGSFTSSQSKKLAQKKVLHSFSTPGRHMSQEEAPMAAGWLQGPGPTRPQHRRTSQEPGLEHGRACRAGSKQAPRCLDRGFLPTQAALPKHLPRAGHSTHHPRGSLGSDTETDSQLRAGGCGGCLNREAGGGLRGYRGGRESFQQLGCGPFGCFTPGASC